MNKQKGVNFSAESAESTLSALPRTKIALLQKENKKQNNVQKI